MTLIIDIGTNGELVLGTKDKLYAASCAAGPALEGARIAHGSRATDGAIEAVVVNGNDIDVDVIGNCPPRSICGSGLIEIGVFCHELGHAIGLPDLYDGYGSSGIGYWGLMS